MRTVEQDSGWIDVTVSERDESTSAFDWVIGIGGLFDYYVEQLDGDETGRLEIQYESITGEPYRYEYEIVAPEDGGDLPLSDAYLVIRELPWIPSKGIED